MYRNKAFDKAIRQIDQWRKGKNHNVTVLSHTYKDAEGKVVEVYERMPANKAWGNPKPQAMKA